MSPLSPLALVVIALAWLSGYAGGHMVGERKRGRPSALNFTDWLLEGRERRYISNIVCETHDSVPLWPEERELFDEGGEPCIPVVRLYGEDGPA